MLFSCIFLAISVSIDALSLGITYGIKKAKMTKIANIIIFVIAFVSTSISILLGSSISKLFSPNIATIIGSSLLILLGIYTIYKSFVKNSIDYDFDNSNSIKQREAIILALSVSADASCAGLSCGIMGINSFIYPLLAAIFHIIFINCGNLLAVSIVKKFNVSNNRILSSISGTILFLIGFIRLFI